MTTSQNPVKIISTPATVADRYRAEMVAMAKALEAADWDRVAAVALHLKATERLIERYGIDADYIQAVLGNAPQRA